MDWTKLVREGLERSEKTATAIHPDPDLLAAFVERSISEPEQRGVLGHLAGCASCRAVVYLAQPEAELPAAILQPQASLWKRWLVVRWAAAAAAVVVMAGTVMLYRGNQENQRLAKVVEPPASQVVASNAAAAEPVVPAAEPRSDVNQEAVAAKRAPETTAARTQAAPIRTLDTATTLAKTDSAPAAPPVLAVVRDGALPEAKAQPAETARMAIVPGSREIVGNITPMVRPNVVALENALTTAPVPTSTQSGGNTRAAGAGLAFAGLRAEAAPSLVGPGRSRRTFTLTNGSARDAVGALGRNTWAGTNFTHIRWSTTGTGQLQKSGDGAQWQPVTVAEGVIFQSVDQGGAEVWAGGTAGALYHSRDDGATWSKVVVAADGEALKEDVTGVSFHQPGSITVHTASGATWVSADGGLHWALHR